VSGLLAYGAKSLAQAKAVVKNLTDVETLGATSAINTDKTGTLTMNEMMVSVLYAGGAWFTVDGEGYRKTGALRSAAGAPVPDFTRLALGLVLDSDATVADDGTVVGDPTEAALVVLAAKLGVDADETRRLYPRLAEVPFDSEYKFMATYHRYRADGVDRVIELVKGAPDVVLGPLRARGRADERLAIPDRGSARRHRRCEPADGQPGTARARVRGPGHRGGLRIGDDRRPDGVHPAVSGSSAWSASSTRCGPRPPAPSTPRCGPASTSA
jgi:magnesium-transporting ATPase (P-type)